MKKIISLANEDKKYNQLITSVGVLLEQARKEVYSQVNNILVKTYWEIGKMIVELEQKGEEKAEYGEKLLDKLSCDLKLRYGKGFSRSNVTYMRLFYLRYNKSETLSHKLSWSHYFELLKIDDNLERSFYEKQSIADSWSVRELKRQKNSALFERVALSKDKQGVIALSKKGLQTDTAEDLVKSPYILEFLGIPEDYRYSEKELEQRVIDNLQKFLLELGKGFAFIGRQFRITLNNKNYYVDLVFYHRILKCFVLIDLKISEVTHYDIGQMNLYLNYFKEEEMVEGDSEPIGIILTKEKEKVFIKYALGGISNKLFVSKYQLYLPDKKELEQQLQQILKSEKE